MANLLQEFDLLRPEQDWAEKTRFARICKALYEGSETDWGLTYARISERMTDVFTLQLMAFEQDRQDRFITGERDVLTCEEAEYTPEERVQDYLLHKTPYSTHFCRYLRSRAEIALYGATAESESIACKKIASGVSVLRAKRYLVPKRRFFILKLKSAFAQISPDPSNPAFALLLKQAYEGEPDHHDPLSAEELSWYIQPVLDHRKNKEHVTRAWVHLLMEQVTIHDLIRRGLVTEKQYDRFRKLSRTRRDELDGAALQELTSFKQMVAENSFFSKPGKKGPSVPQLQRYAREKVPEMRRTAARVPRGLTSYEIAARHPEISRSQIHYKRMNLAAERLVEMGFYSEPEVTLFKWWRKEGLAALPSDQKEKYKEFQRLASLVLESDLAISRPTKKSLLHKEYVAHMYFILCWSDDRIGTVLGMSRSYIQKKRLELGISGRRIRVTKAAMAELKRQAPGFEEYSQRLTELEERVKEANRALYRQVVGTEPADLGDHVDLRQRLSA